MSARTVVLGYAAMAVIIFAPDGNAWWLALHLASGFVMGHTIAKAATFDAREAK